MCINFNGSHSGGSTFVNVNDCWLIQKLLYTADISSALKIYIYNKESQYMVYTPKPVQIRQSGRTGIGGVTYTLTFYVNNVDVNMNQITIKPSTFTYTIT